MSFTEFIPLGTNGFYASCGRETMTFLVFGGAKQAILLDAGSGVSRLGEPAFAQRLEQLERLDVILTHFHLDHVSGLPSLAAVLNAQQRGIELVLWAPAPPLVDGDPKVALARLVSPPLFPVGIDRFHEWMTVKAYTKAEDLATIPLLSNISVRVRRQTHAGASAGLRLGLQLAYITDTIADEKTIDLVRDVDLLVHDVWVSEAEANSNPSLISGHADAASARRIAESAGVRRLMPVHHHPHKDDEALAELHRELASPHYQIVHGKEGKSIRLAQAVS